MLTSGIGTLPLTPLADFAPEELPHVLRRMQQRLDAEAPTAAEEGEFWTATTILMGLRYSEAQTFELMKGVRRMKESVTYQAIVREGRAEGSAKGIAEGLAEGCSLEARSVILRLGERRFGPVGESTTTALNAVSSVDRLEQLVDRILEVESWDELLA